MKQMQDIATELREISTVVANIEKANPFSIPAGYFDEFPGKMLAIVVQHNAVSISSKEEIEEISPLLASLRNKETFAVPRHYFEQFRVEEITRVEVQQQPQPELAPVRSISGSRKWLRYAAAAVVAGLIGLGVLFFTNNTSGVTDDIMAQKTKAAINQQSSQSVDELSKLPDDALNGYLAQMPSESDSDEIDSADSAFFNLAMVNIDEKGLKDYLHDLSDEDLKNFAEANREYLSL